MFTSSPLGEQGEQSPHVHQLRDGREIDIVKHIAMTAS